MANTNTLTEVMPVLLAQGLVALREQAVIARMVNTNYSNEVKQKGNVVDIPIPSAITVQAVSPSYVAPDDAAVVPTSVSITLDKWYEAPFFLSDKDIGDCMEGTIPMQASEAVKAVGNQVSNDLYALYKKVYGFYGTAGTTPFAGGAEDATGARKILNDQLCPMDPRYGILDTAAEANALGLAAFNANAGTQEKGVMIDGTIGKKLGALWVMDQLIPDHTTGAVGTILVDGTVAAGLTALHIDGATTKPSVGDVFTIAGNAQTYTVISATDLNGTDSDLVISPALVAEATNDLALTFKASHTANLLMHRDAFALAIRPLETPGNGLGNLIMAASDPQTGLGLRLEISRQHKRTRYSYDILYGVACPRPEFAVRLAG